MACARDLRQMIASAASAAGVEPGIALAVASRESGICQWNADGSVKVGAAGEIGVFQVMPSTAPGVDLSDVSANIAAGVGYLAQMYQQFGTWALAVAAYNDGPGNVQHYIAGTRPLPQSTLDYVRAVTSIGLVQSNAVQVAINNQTAMAPDGSTADPNAGAGVSSSADNSAAWWLLGGVGLAAAWLMWGE